VLLAASHVAFTVLRVAGACYLVFLGAKMFLRKHALVRESAISKRTVSENASAPRWFLRGVLTNLLNPKVGVFYVTFLPQFIPAGVNVTGFGMWLAGIHATEGLLWFLLLTLATRPISHWLSQPRVAQTFDRATGGLLVVLGIGLALDNR
jgi:threonine/homoserine/homoserine lactone efflux protein